MLTDWFSNFPGKYWCSSLTLLFLAVKQLLDRAQLSLLFFSPHRSYILNNYRSNYKISAQLFKVYPDNKPKHLCFSASQKPACSDPKIPMFSTVFLILPQPFFFFLTKAEISLNHLKHMLCFFISQARKIQFSAHRTLCPGY